MNKVALSYLKRDTKDCSPGRLQLVSVQLHTPSFDADASPKFQLTDILIVQFRQAGILNQKESGISTYGLYDEALCFPVRKPRKSLERIDFCFRQNEMFA